MTSEFDSFEKLERISNSADRTVNIVAEFHQYGQDAWKHVGARVCFLEAVRESTSVKIPKILAPAENDNPARTTAIVVTQLHLEETSGPISALMPELWCHWREQGLDLLFYFVNQHGLFFREDGDSSALREDERGMNYNDGWGQDLDAPIEVAVVQKDIEREIGSRNVVLAISTHEDSDMPGLGFVYASGVSERQRLKFVAEVKERHQDDNLASLVPSQEELYGGHVGEADYLIVDSGDPGCFEDWISERGVPTFLVEAPYGLDLKTRIRFQMNMVNAAINSLFIPG